MRKSIIYKLKATVRDFITFEKLSINNIHFGFNQSNSYYLMGKNNSVNGEVMFKFDASKYDIKDGNVTFWVWSPDIPSLGSVPILASSTQGSAQSQTGNIPKLGYSSATAESKRYYISWFGAVKVPYVYLEVSNSFAFYISIRAKLFDPNDNPMPYKKMKTIVRLYGGTLDWITDTSWWIIFASEAPILDNTFQNYTDGNGEYKISMKLNVPPYLKFGILYVYAGFDEAWLQWWPPLYLPAGTIYTSLTMPVGKWVTKLISDVNAILKHSDYELQFYNTTEEVKEESDGILKFNITTYKYSAEIWKTSSSTKLGKIKDKEKYIGFYFKMKLGPDYYRRDIEQPWNYIMDLTGDGTTKAVSNFYKIYDKRLENELKSINNDKDLTNLASKNIFTRVIFKWILQLRYHLWDNLGDLGKAREAYKNNILNSKSLVLLLIASTSISWPSPFQKFLSQLLKVVYNFAPVSSPAFLYSLTLSAGDYRYILVAMDGSISTILGSLAIGLIETKIQIRNLLKGILDVLKGIADVLTLIATILLVLTFIIRSKVVGIAAAIAAFAAAFAWAQIYLYENYEYPYLKSHPYSPQYLLNLVKITEYDLTLLNYEINLWNHLKD